MCPEDSSQKAGQKVKISVVVPVYNSEQYLRAAVKSLQDQEFDGFEILLVDDGSTDGSPRICDELAGEDSRIRAFHKENGGICNARNYGLRQALGEYVTFCDNDDEAPPGFLSENYRRAAEAHADVVRFCRKRVATSGGNTIVQSQTGGFAEQVIKKEDLGRQYPEVKKAGSGVWTGLYRTAFLRENGILFDEAMRFGLEDHMFNLQCCAHMKTMVLNPGVYYCWLQRVEHSTSGKFGLNYVDSLKKCAFYEDRLIRDSGADALYPGFRKYVLASNYIPEIYERLGPQRSGNLTDEERKAILRDYRNSLDPLITGEKAADRYIWKESRKLFLIWKLFQKRRLWFLYCLTFRRPGKK